MARTARRLIPSPSRGARAAALLVAILPCSVLLEACSSSEAAGLAHRACTHVAAAEQYMANSRSSGPQTARRLEHRAERQLALALPLAAQAAGLDGSWQALEANLQQTHNVPSREILPALRADCAGNG